MPRPPLGRSNNDDRRQWRKQGVAVGAAASKTQAKRCGCWVLQPGQWHAVRRDGEVNTTIEVLHMGKEAKTNAMRILERAKVAYTAHEYPHEEGVAVDGVTVAASIGEDPACVYKTLVTQGNSKNYFVFVIPVAAELDLKAAARSVGEKSVAMIHVADINKVTGYVRGGCSPVGMKKQYTTVFDESVLSQPKVYVSGGRIGTQVCCAPADLIKAARATTAKIIFLKTLPRGESLRGYLL